MTTKRWANRVNLQTQVQRVLPLANGGNGNGLGNAAQVLQCMNLTGGSLALGTVVKLKHSFNDLRVIATTSAADPDVLGVVVGTYTDDDPDQFVATAAPSAASVAVMVRGLCTVLVSAAVTRGQLLYTSSTAGQASSAASPPTTGAFGTVIQSTSGSGSALALVDSTIASDWRSYGGVDIVLDGGGSALTTGVKVDVEMKYAATIRGVTLVADQTGSIVLDLWKDTYANFPPTVADTITASAKPTLSSASKYQDTTLTGWTTSVARGDIIRVNVDSVGTITRCTLGLQLLRT